MNKTPFLTAAVCVVGVVLMCCCTYRVLMAEGQAREPHLVFKKSVLVKEYKGGQAYSAPHTVRKGDHLWKILREQYNMSNKRIAFYCRIAKAINPQIKNIDVLEPKQNILVPYKYVKGSPADNATKPFPEHDVEYVIKEGQHLGKILRDNYNLPEYVIFSKRTFRLIKEANPAIENINNLEKGQKIILPAALFDLSAYTTPAPAAPRIVKTAPAPPRPEPVITPAQLQRAPEKTVPAPVIPYVVTPEEKQVRSAMSMLTRSFDGLDNRTGTEVLPIEGSGSVTIDHSKFPVYEFPWGKKILFDYGNKLPEGVKDVIASEWENAEVVAVQEKDDMKSILDTVLDSCGFFKVEKKGEFITKRDNIQISVGGDWIVFKDTMMKNVFVVNLIDGNRREMSPELKAYISDMGLQIVDIKTGGAPAAKKEDAPGEKPAKTEYQSVSSEPALLTDLILEAAGIEYKKGYNTEIFQNMYNGFSLEIIADRMFVKDGATYLIDFHSLPERIVQIIEKQNFKLLQITPQDDMAETAQKVLDFCAVTYKPSPVKFTFDKDGESNIKLTIPGVLVSSDAGEVLLTRVALDMAIVTFLSDKKIKIIKY